MQLALETTVVLLCRVGTHFCALPIEHVSETMRPLSVVPLAGTPAFVFGLSIIRGSPVPVIDAGQLVGVTGQRRPARFVTIKVNRRSHIRASGDDRHSRNQYKASAIPLAPHHNSPSRVLRLGVRRPQHHRPLRQRRPLLRQCC